MLKIQHYSTYIVRVLAEKRIHAGGFNKECFVKT